MSSTGLCHIQIAAQSHQAAVSFIQADRLTVTDRAAVHVECTFNIQVTATSVDGFACIVLDSLRCATFDRTTVHIKGCNILQKYCCAIFDSCCAGCIQRTAKELHRAETNPQAAALVHFLTPGNKCTCLRLAGVHNSQICAFAPCRKDTQLIPAVNGIAAQIQRDPLVLSDHALIGQFYVLCQIEALVTYGQGGIFGPCLPQKRLAIAPIGMCLTATDTTVIAHCQTVVSINRLTCISIGQEASCAVILGFFRKETAGCNDNLTVRLQPVHIYQRFRRKLQLADIHRASQGEIYLLAYAHAMCNRCIFNMQGTPNGIDGIGMFIRCALTYGGTHNINCTISTQVATGAVYGSTAGDRAALHIQSAHLGHIDAAAVFARAIGSTAQDLHIALDIDLAVGIDIGTRASGVTCFDNTAGNIDHTGLGNIQVTTNTHGTGISCNDAHRPTLCNLTAEHIKITFNVYVTATAVGNISGFTGDSQRGSTQNLTAIHIKGSAFLQKDRRTIFYRASLGRIQCSTEELHRTKADPQATALVHLFTPGDQLTGLGLAGVYNSQICALTPGCKDSKILFAVDGVAPQIQSNLLVFLDHALVGQFHISNQIEIVILIGQRTIFCPGLPKPCLAIAPAGMTIITTGATVIAYRQAAIGINCLTCVSIRLEAACTVILRLFCKEAAGCNNNTTICFQGIYIYQSLRGQFQFINVHCACQREVHLLAHSQTIRNRRILNMQASANGIDGICILFGCASGYVCAHNMNRTLATDIAAGTTLRHTVGDLAALHVQGSQSRYVNTAAILTGTIDSTAQDLHIALDVDLAVCIDISARAGGLTVLDNATGDIHNTGFGHIQVSADTHRTGIACDNTHRSTVCDFSVVHIKCTFNVQITATAIGNLTGLCSNRQRCTAANLTTIHIEGGAAFNQHTCTIFHGVSFRSIQNTAK